MNITSLLLLSGSALVALATGAKLWRFLELRRSKMSGQSARPVPKPWYAGAMLSIGVFSYVFAALRWRASDDILPVVWYVSCAAIGLTVAAAGLILIVLRLDATRHGDLASSRLSSDPGLITGWALVALGLAAGFIVLPIALILLTSRS
jgi:hypothetical protein